MPRQSFVNMSLSRNVMLGVIALFCIASYFNTLFADFVWDDTTFVKDSVYFHSFKYLPEFFTNDLWKFNADASSSGYYRPLLPATIMCDYALWKLQPFGYHLTNILLHTITTILLFLFLTLLAKDPRVPFASALLFGVHPIHTEAVSFMSCRNDVMVLMFSIASLFFFLKHAREHKWFAYPLSLACFFLSLLSKEMAVTLPFVILGVDFLFLSKANLKNTMRNFFRYHLGFFIILGLYFAIRFYICHLPLKLATTHHFLNFINGTSRYWRLCTVLKIIAMYVRLLFLPYNLTADYLFAPANSFFEPQVFAGTLLVISLVFVALRNIKKNPLFSFAIAWFFMTILPVANIIPEGNIFAERYLYMPSVGFCAAMGFVFVRVSDSNVRTNFFNWKALVYVLFLFFLVALARITFERNKVWYNNLTLWYDTVKKTPNTPRAHLNLANVYAERGLLDKAIDEYTAVLKLSPNYYYEALVSLGMVYVRRQELDKAIEVYSQAKKLNPKRALAYNGLAVAYGGTGKYKESIEAGRTALDINPYFDDARYNLAISYGKAGLKEQSIRTFEEYLKNNPPNSPAAHMYVGQLYFEKGDRKNARLHWLAAIKNDETRNAAEKALKQLDKPDL